MTEIIISILAGLFITIVGLAVVLPRISRYKMISLFDWTIVFIVALYGIGFPVIYISTYLGYNIPSKEIFIMQYRVIDIIIFYTFVCLLILFIYLGWKSLRNKKILVQANVDGTILEKNIKRDFTYIELRYLRKFISFAWIMLIISILTYYLYALAYGGFIGLLSNTIAIRSGVSNIYNPFSFFQKFGQFSFVSAFSFYAIILDSNIKRSLKKTCYAGFLLSIIFSLYVAFSWGGRGLIVELFLIYILGAIYLKSDKIIKFISKFSKRILFLPIIFLIIDRLWNRSGGLDFWNLIVSATSYPFIAFIVNLQSNIYRWFTDILYIPLYFLPSSIWKNGLNIHTTNSITTYLTLGAEKGEVINGSIVTGTATNDLLTFSYMQGNIFGIIIIGLLFGLLLRAVHNNIINLNFNGIKWVFYSYAVVRFAIGIVKGGDLSQIIIGNWGFFIYIILFFVYRKIKL